MQYNLRNPLHKVQFKVRSAMLLEKSDSIVELTTKKPKRSKEQNSYLHVILAYFALQNGDTLEWVKQQYFKKLVNPDIFIRVKDDRFMGRVKFLRSSSELDSAEMITAITRFRNWASSEAGIYLPEPNEDEECLKEMEVEISRNKEYLYGR